MMRCFLFLFLIFFINGCATATKDVHYITILPTNAHGAEYQAAQTLFEKGYETSMMDTSADALLSIKMTQNPLQIQYSLLDTKQNIVLWTKTTTKRSADLKDPLLIPSMTTEALRSFPQRRGTKPLNSPIGQAKLAPAIIAPKPVIPVKMPVMTPPPAPSVTAVKAPTPANINVALSPATNKALAGPSMNILIPAPTTPQTKADQE